MPDPPGGFILRLPCHACCSQILKLDLPAEAIECAVRTYCSSGQQWERASMLFEGMLSKGLRPTELTVVAVFEALVVGRQGQKAHLLLQVRPEGEPASERSRISREGHLQRLALALQRVRQYNV